MRSSSSIRFRAAVCTLAVAGHAVVRPEPAWAASEPAWVGEFEDKARGWLAEVEGAWNDVSAAAEGAMAEASAIVEARVEEVLEDMRAHKDALVALLKSEGEAWSLLLEQRVGEFLTVADRFRGELTAIVEGTADHVTLEWHRAVAGLRATVQSTIESGGRRIEATRLVDGRLVAEVVDRTAKRARIAGATVGAAAGIGLVAVGLAVPRAWWAKLVLAVIGAAGLGVSLWFGIAAYRGLHGEVVLGTRSCAVQTASADFIARHGTDTTLTPALRTEATRLRAGLWACFITADERSVAEIVDLQIEQLDRVIASPSPP